MVLGGVGGVQVLDDGVSAFRRRALSCGGRAVPFSVISP